MFLNNIPSQNRDSVVLDQVEHILTTQYTPELAKVLLSNPKALRLSFSRKTRKLRYIYRNNQLFLAFIPTTGLFVLSLPSAQLIHEHTVSQFPVYRVVVQNEVREFMIRGKSVFSQHVVNVDPNLRVNQEVLVVDEDDVLLALGKLTLPPHYIIQQDVGVVVNVKKGNKALQKK